MQVFPNIGLLRLVVRALRRWLPLRIKPSHRFVLPLISDGQIRRRLGDICVAKPPLNDVQRQTGIEPAAYAQRLTAGSQAAKVTAGL